MHRDPQRRFAWIEHYDRLVHRSSGAWCWRKLHIGTKSAAGCNDWRAERNLHRGAKRRGMRRRDRCNFQRDRRRRNPRNRNRQSNMEWRRPRIVHDDRRKQFRVYEHELHSKRQWRRWHQRIPCGDRAMRRFARIPLFLIATPLAAQYGGVFGAPTTSVPTIATITIGSTPGNPIPATVIGTSEPSTDLYLYYPRHTNCVISSAAPAGQPKCTSNPSGLGREVMPTLFQQWTNNAFMGATPYNRSFLHRIEMDPQGPYDFQCYDVPIGQAIAGSSAGAALTWSATANGTSGVTRFYTQGTTLTNQGTSGYATTGIVATTTSGSGSGMLLYVTASGGKITAANVAAWGTGYATGDHVLPTEAGSSGDAYVTITDTKPTGAFYLHGFASADGFPAPSTPANVSAAYTVLGSGNGYFDVTTGVLTGTGSDNGYWTLQSQWYGWYTTAPTCASGSLFPSTSALYDPVIGLLQYDPYIQVSVATDQASSGYCNGHRFGPAIGTGTFGTVVPPATGMCYATENIRQWNNALTSGAAQFDKNAVGVNYLTSGPGGTAQLIAYEMGNEPDNYPTQAQTNAWFYRFSTFGLYADGITQAWIPMLSPASIKTG